ncbi:MAG: cytochrome b/b6 domain-containing protein [Proteobacteria bacterium]|nr:cytochrome b/b6 domain-containing protein [Pseudomonadota bacterium]
MTVEEKYVRVWDRPTRLFHWALVVLVVLQFATAKFGFLSMDWHYRFGWATLVLIAFRIVWGFIGSQTSRFVDFVRSPVAVWRYVRCEWLPVGKTSAPSDRAKPVGHNPLGGWSVVIMLACILVQAVSGLFTSDDIDAEGPFVGAVSNATIKLASWVHHLGETALLVLIALHVVAIVLHRWLKRDDLVVPMLTGGKRVDAPTPRFVSAWLALAVLVLLAMAAAALSRLGG